MRCQVLLGGGAAVIAAGRSNLRPVAPAPLTTPRLLASLGVLAVMALLVFAPTWYTMTHAEF